MAAINLRNYTTEVPASRSIENIENLLVQFGATNIMKEYEAGNCVSISFRLIVQNHPFAFKLPAKVAPIFKWLRKNKSKGDAKRQQAQAERIAWKHQHELLHMQLTSIELEQADMMQVFLPYVYDVASNKTFYEQLKEGSYKALLPEGR
ncbi:MAG: hypothetical protein EKK37_17435 [Sphingobacteriales bacterium]|nr:MAG: hypothetical protein EKK37_17435 [Sphingobacteriales bacterium]